MNRLKQEHGFTLVEVMVAAMVLVIGTLGAFALLDGANQTTVSNNARMGATNLAREIIEDARSLDYDVLTDTALLPALQAKPGMTSTSGPSTWTIVRRGITFTVETSVCVFDDPKDGVAATPPADVCSPQAPVPAAITSPPTENQPDDFRRVGVKLSWDTGRGPLSMNQTGLINNPSGGLGPRIKTFDDKAQVSSSASSVSFPTVTATSAASVRWNSDGTPNGAGDSTGGPLNWSTDWALGAPATPIAPPATGAWPAQYGPDTVLDGIYTLTAQAYDDRGIAGDARVAILPLNRSFPLTVTGFEAGRNSFLNTIEFQWEPNPERDIIGYEVWDSGPDSTIRNGNDTKVCSTSKVSATTCTLSGAPSGTPSYFVVALDKEVITDPASNTRSSQNAMLVTVPSSPPAAPSAPLLLPIALESSTGKPQLSWTHLALSEVRFFRIYRDHCCDLADRYGATADNATTWIDPNPGNTAHRYWVTAVGPTFNESSQSNHSDSP